MNSTQISKYSTYITSLEVLVMGLLAGLNHWGFNLWPVLRLFLALCISQSVSYHIFKEHDFLQHEREPHTFLMDVNLSTSYNSILFCISVFPVGFVNEYFLKNSICCQEKLGKIISLPNPLRILKNGEKCIF